MTNESARGQDPSTAAPHQTLPNAKPRSWRRHFRSETPVFGDFLMKNRLAIPSLAPPRLVFRSFARTTSRARKTALFLFSVAVLLPGGTPAVRGQSALDGFDPNANDAVRVVVVQSDGKILIGGSSLPAVGRGTRPHCAANIRTARSTPLQPQRGRYRPLHRGAGGWEGYDGRWFQAPRDIGAQMRVIIAQARRHPPDWRIRSTRLRMTGLTSFPIAVQADTKILVGGF